MLVLKRKIGEAILVGQDVQIEVIEISRSHVKLGVTAPRTVNVVRREISRVATQNQLAIGLINRGVENLAIQLGLLQADAKEGLLSADMHLEDIPGIRQESENPNPA